MATRDRLGPAIGKKRRDSKSVRLWFLTGTTGTTGAETYKLRELSGLKMALLVLFNFGNLEQLEQIPCLQGWGEPWRPARSLAAQKDEGPPAGPGGGAGRARLGGGYSVPLAPRVKHTHRRSPPRHRGKARPCRRRSPPGLKPVATSVGTKTKTSQNANEIALADLALEERATLPEFTRRHTWPMRVATPRPPRRHSRTP